MLIHLHRRRRGRQLRTVVMVRGCWWVMGLMVAVRWRRVVQHGLIRLHRGVHRGASARAVHDSRVLRRRMMRRRRRRRLLMGRCVVSGLSSSATAASGSTASPISAV
jgi:hypothetical protein